LAFSAKRSRVETVPLESSISGKTLNIQKSIGFGQLIAGEAITIRSNLAQHRRDIAMQARDFLATEVCVTHQMGGLKALPWGLDIEISGSTMISDHKFVSVRYAMNLSEAPSKVVVGQTPVEMKFGLRKGHFVLSNKTSLGLTYDDWTNLLRHGRDMLTELRTLENRSFDSFEDVDLPEMRVVREIRADGFGQKQTMILLLTVSLAKKRDSDICVPVINIREYAEDTKNDCFLATQKGVGLGLKSFYRLLFPVAEAARKFHDLFLTVKVGLDEYFVEVDKRFSAIQKTLKDEGGVWRHLDDDKDELTKDERRVTGTENVLNDSVADDMDDIIALQDLESDALASAF